MSGASTNSDQFQWKGKGFYQHTGASVGRNSGHVMFSSELVGIPIWLDRPARAAIVSMSVWLDQPARAAIISKPVWLDRLAPMRQS